MNKKFSLHLELFPKLQLVFYIPTFSSNVKRIKYYMYYSVCRRLNSKTNYSSIIKCIKVYDFNKSNKNGLNNSYFLCCSLSLKISLSGILSYSQCVVVS